MLHFPRWQIALILVVVIGGFLAKANIERTVVSTTGVKQWKHDHDAPNALSADGNLQWRSQSIYRQLTTLGFFPAPAVPWPHRIVLALRRWLRRLAAFSPRVF